MKMTRFAPVLAIIVAAVVGGVVIAKLHRRIQGLKESRHAITSRYQELAATNSSLLSIDAEQNDELARLRRPNLELLRLRGQLTQARLQLAAATNQTPSTEDANGAPGYIAKEQLKFVGFDTPENAFQSMYWAGANGDYTNWLASLSPDGRAEELADKNSQDRFRAYASRIVGVKVLAAKSVGTDRVELKVQLNTENSTVILIYPMGLSKNQWHLAGDIDSYTRAWDSAGEAQ